MNKKILVILGPTASGKSDLAVRLAKKFKGEIVSADSRQVYKHLNVGTGKITRKEMKGVPHHLLDVVEPQKQFSVAQYKKLAEEEIKFIERRHKLPIVVGGTGFYIDALAGLTVFPDVPVNKKLREKLGQKTNIGLFKMLEKKDASRARTIDPNNKVRLIRALEIVEALGKVPKLKVKPHKHFIYIGLNPENLEERIEKRLKRRMSGILKEVRGLLSEKKVTKKRLYDLGLEYRYAAMLIDEKLSKEEMFAQLSIAIRQYAKRQMTWFKRNKKIKWFESKDYKEIERYARSVLAK